MAGSKTCVALLVLFAVACLVVAARGERDDKVRPDGASGIHSVGAGSLRASDTGSWRRSLLQNSQMEPSWTAHHRSEPNCNKEPGVCKEKGSKGPACCYGKCVNEQTDSHHCGSCGRVVPKNFACCKGHPVNLSKSPYNCGKCGVRCPGNGKCEFGTCNYAS